MRIQIQFDYYRWIKYAKIVFQCKGKRSQIEDNDKEE
jgi:hypothetical protein